MATLGAARQVSPFIRFGRYTALITGFVYGTVHLRSLTSKEAKIQEHEGKIKEARNAKLKVDKDNQTAVEMNALGKECGVAQQL